MRRSLWIALAAVIIGAPAITWLTTHSAPARVFGRDERIVVRPSNGQWYHTYSVLLGVIDSSKRGAATDTLRVTVAQREYDASRMGAHVQLKHNTLIPQLSWISDSSSVGQTLVRFMAARLKSNQKPVAMSPLETQTAGLARVVAIHSVQRPTAFWQKNDKTSSDRSHWIQLVEVEFFALRVRTLVRTIDVIDAGSMPGLHAGDIVQMHYDQNNPRVMRLDDGMRTFDAGRH